MRILAILGLCIAITACATTDDPSDTDVSSAHGLTPCANQNIVRDSGHERARLKTDETSWAFANSVESVRREYSDPAYAHECE